MSRGVSSRSMSRQHALRNSTVVFTGRHGRTVRRRLSHLNLLAAEKFPDHGHFEFQRHRETGRLLHLPRSIWLTIGKSTDVSKYRDSP